MVMKFESNKKSSDAGAKTAFFQESSVRGMGGASCARIGFIGAGNMAEAIIKGALDKKAVSPEDLIIFDIDIKKQNQMAAKGIEAAQSASWVVERSHIVFLAVKPQNYEEVLSEISAVTTEEKIFVSIAAGISTDYIVKKLGKRCGVVRAMPNTPLLAGCGATALCAASGVQKEYFDMVYRLFDCSGIVEVLPEDQMNAVIAVNGSSPAYLYLIAKAMTDYAAEQGIDKGSALNLVCAVFEGAAKMLKESGDDADRLIKNVSSPGGTTIAALNTFQTFDLYGIIKKAMDNCTKRAFELGGG